MSKTSVIKKMLDEHNIDYLYINSSISFDEDKIKQDLNEPEIIIEFKNDTVTVEDILNS